MTDDAQEERLKPRLTRKETFWLVFFVLLVCGVIWLGMSDVWDRMFSGDEAPVEDGYLQSIHDSTSSWS